MKPASAIGLLPVPVLAETWYDVEADVVAATFSIRLEYVAPLCHVLEFRLVVVGHMPPKRYNVRCDSVASMRLEKENADPRKFAPEAPAPMRAEDRVVEVCVQVPLFDDAELVDPVVCDVQDQNEAAEEHCPEYTQIDPDGEIAGE